MKKVKTDNNNNQTSKQNTNKNNNNSGNTLSHENILKSIIDSYIVPLTNGENNRGFFDVKTYLPNVIVLLHQNQCLKKCLDSSVKLSAEGVKLRERWMEILNYLLKPSNSNLWVGIHLLCETIRVCDYDIMISKLDQWLALLTQLVEGQKKSIQQKQNGASNKLAYKSGSKKEENNITFKEYGSIIIVLSLLVEKATKWNDLKRTITNNTVMSPIVHLILTSLDKDLGYPDECKVDSLVAITSLIQSASTALKPYLNKIETLVYPLLFNNNKSIQESASSVIAHLPQCVGINSTEFYWDVSVQKILKEMNDIIDNVFTFLEDDDKQNGGGNKTHVDSPKVASGANSSRQINLPSTSKLINIGDDANSMLKSLVNVKFPEAPKEPHLQTSFYIKAFFGLSHCLLRIFSTSSATASPVPIDEVIKLICRILNPNLNHLTFSNLIMSFSISQMIYIIQQLHLQAFIILSGILKIFRKSLLVHCKTISALLLRPLKSLNYSLMSPIIHAQIYSTISDAVESFGASSSESLAVPVLKILLRDILPYIPESISQTASTTAVSNGKQQSANSTTASSSVIQQNIRNTINQTIGNVDTTLQDFNSLTIKQNSLTALSSILLHCGSYLQQQQQQGYSSSNAFEEEQSTNINNTNKNILRFEIDQLLVSLLLECQSLASVKKNSITYLNSSYNCWRYRSKLYECLIHCVLKPVSNTPPVLPYAMRIFTNGMNTDHYPRVRTICCKGLSVCESIIHPQTPSLSTTQSVHSLSMNLNYKGGSSTNILSDDEGDNLSDDEDYDSLNDSDDLDDLDEGNIDEEDDDLNEKIEINSNDLETDDLDESIQEEQEEEEQEEEEEEEEEEQETESKEEIKLVKGQENNNVVMKTSLFSASTITQQQNSVKISKIETKKSFSATSAAPIEDEDDDNDLDLPDIED
ncbi:hypothetical protein DICPUDRAFT_50833 [Dictyostelium purpureum]|uniref:Uncharacterized protein n=1 Tax=Dictyostelium purpureum TaxID=5786 RepID=F1A0L8_DICPU|nr:uncharacterized protein DICPUDRAFT_50833 [Dictyostelium purpureum]EGC30258.1 hypothetical protein DICPUDRAFT_50833 [Dictyostelium purpureum]|eukprot:XP_003293210.1 hypothetical protein DICPUDRAFT_50833 [Dictyostelium purpureum]